MVHKKREKETSLSDRSAESPGLEKIGMGSLKEFRDVEFAKICEAESNLANLDSEFENKLLKNLN